jgi:hypothetical protein
MHRSALCLHHRAADPLRQHGPLRTAKRQCPRPPGPGFRGHPPQRHCRRPQGRSQRSRRSCCPAWRPPGPPRRRRAVALRSAPTLHHRPVTPSRSLMPFRATRRPPAHAPRPWLRRHPKGQRSQRWSDHGVVTGSRRAPPQNQSNINTGMLNKPVARGGPRSRLYLSVSSMESTRIQPSL